MLDIIQQYCHDIKCMCCFVYSKYIVWIVAICSILSTCIFRPTVPNTHSPSCIGGCRLDLRRPVLEKKGLAQVLRHLQTIKQAAPHTSCGWHELCHPQCQEWILGCVMQPSICPSSFCLAQEWLHFGQRHTLIYMYTILSSFISDINRTTIWWNTGPRWAIYPTPCLNPSLVPVQILNPPSALQCRTSFSADFAVKTSASVKHAKKHQSTRRSTAKTSESPVK